MNVEFVYMYLFIFIFQLYTFSWTGFFLVIPLHAKKKYCNCAPGMSMQVVCCASVKHFKVLKWLSSSVFFIVSEVGLIKNNVWKETKWLHGFCM